MLTRFYSVSKKLTFSKRKEFSDEVKIKLSGKRIYPTTSVKYLGVLSPFLRK